MSTKRSELKSVSKDKNMHLVKGLLVCTHTHAHTHTHFKSHVTQQP